MPRGDVLERVEHADVGRRIAVPARRDGHDGHEQRAAHPFTLPVALANLSGEHVQDIELMMAGAVVTVLPVLAVFMALQRYYIAGLMAGSVKG